jgi:phosphomannomutase/phosphoglucomutase
MSIYKDCDIRGKYGMDLMDFHAEKLGQSVIQLKGKVDIIVAGDGRLSTPNLKHKLIQALNTGGCRVLDLGILPTPAFYYARRSLGIENAIMVTASHNPAGDNGFKINLGPLPITPQELQELSQIMEQEQHLTSSSLGQVEHLDFLPTYIQAMQTYAPALPGMRVVVDCAHGMAALVAKPIWQVTGAEMVYLFDRVDGSFPAHAPNPAQPENLIALEEAIQTNQADLGIAYDGDADRVAFVDQSGKPLLNDKAIVLFARTSLEKGPGVVVYDQKCSRVVPETVLSLGGEAYMERSGHTFIKTAFLQKSALYAGEISGHHFFKEIFGDDGIYASLRMAEIILKQGKSLASLSASIPDYPITPDIRLPLSAEVVERVISDLKNGLANEVKITTLDGVRADYEDGWGIARPSVTESAITLRFEGTSQASLKRIMSRFVNVARDLGGRLPLDIYQGNEEL